MSSGCVLRVGFPRDPSSLPPFGAVTFFSATSYSLSQVLGFLGAHRRHRLDPIKSPEKATESLPWQGLPLTYLTLEATEALLLHKVDTNSSHRLLFCASSHRAMGGSQR